MRTRSRARSGPRRSSPSARCPSSSVRRSSPSTESNCAKQRRSRSAQKSRNHLGVRPIAGRMRTSSFARIVKPRRMAGAVGLFVCIAGGVAAGAPLPPDKLDIPLFVDESIDSISLRNHDDTYGFEARGQMWGVRSPSDQLRLEWRQRGKLLATASCRLRMHPGDDPTAGYECRHDDGLKAAGPVEANLIFKDDRDDKEYLVRTFRLDVKRFAKGTWQITSDDLLADAWARHVTSEPHASSVYFRFWMTGRLLSTAMLRCTANGSPVPDVPVTLLPRGGFAADIIPAKGARKTWTWSLVELQTDRLHHGKKQNAQPEDAAVRGRRPGQGAVPSAAGRGGHAAPVARRRTDRRADPQGGRHRSADQAGRAREEPPVRFAVAQAPGRQGTARSA